MNFYIKLVRLYFNSANYEDYTFEPNKINVITGDSGTGKTSILSIIDYCLMANENNIPYDIQKKVTWFLITFNINGKVWSVARKSPLAGMSGEVYFSENYIDEKLKANITVGDFKEKMNSEFKLDNKYKYPLDYNYSENQFSISYRDFLIFNAITESNIGAKDKYWDTDYFGNENFEGRIDTLFNLSVGVNNLEEIKAKNKLNIIEGKIRDIVRIENSNKRNLDKLNALYEKCLHEGIIISSVTSEEDKLGLISSALDRFNKLISSNDYFLEINNLEEQKSNINFELNVLKRYKKQYLDYKKNLEKNSDSLMPVIYLKSKLDAQVLKTFETKDFILELENSLKSIRNKSKEIIFDYEFSDDSYIILENEKNEIDDKLKELYSLQEEIDNLNKKAFKFGEISTEYYGLNKKVVKNKNVDLEEKKELLKYKNDLKKIVDSNYDKENSIKDLNECIQKNFDSIETMNNYKNYQTFFDIDKKKLRLSPGSNQFDFPIDNVGSKSNYMFLHLCTFLGFHEHFLSRPDNYVLNFLFIDQPSIPYYYGDSRSKDDKRKLVDAFKLINSFMKRILKKWNFQIILIEHAPKNYWEESDLNYYHVVSEFVNGNALIPRSIFEK